MNPDWKPGDRALCVGCSDANMLKASLDAYDYPYGLCNRGTVYLVNEVSIQTFIGMKDQVCLSLAGNPGARLKRDGRIIPWWHGVFRKIVPLCDQATIEEHNHDLR